MYNRAHHLKRKWIGLLLMHTDEFEISLSRELDVCRKSMRKIQKFLRRMEKKYNFTTEEFVEKYKKSELSTLNDDFITWNKKYEALMWWTERQKEFKKLFLQMKI
jgi:hypothetical protein